MFYIFTAIANATVATVRSATGSAIVGAASNSAYVVSEKPMHITYSMNIDAGNVYGVDTTEMAFANTGSGEEAHAVPHAGWVKRTAGSGGRAGRFHYEVLVAGSSITGDAADDTVLPDPIDMNEDPNNDHNLAETYPDIVKDFKAKIEAWKTERNL